MGAMLRITRDDHTSTELRALSAKCAEGAVMRRVKLMSPGLTMNKSDIEPNVIGLFMRAAPAVCLVTSGLLVSCTVRRPDDLRVNGIETMTTTQAGISPSSPSKAGSSGVLDIDIVTSIDLYRLAGSYGAPKPGFLVLYCGLPIGNGPRTSIVSRDSITERSGIRDGFQDSQGKFHYTILAYISDDGTNFGSGPPYDLLRYPRDICISTRGGNEAGFGFKSNEAVASAAQIVAAVRQH